LLAASLAHLLGEFLDPCPQVIALSAETALLLIQFGCPIDIGEIDVPTSQGGFDAFKIFAKPADI
jgi:hypothetical protein